jgi:hypothetical protein
MTNELNIKIQNYNLISTRVNRPTTIHLRFQRKSTSYTLLKIIISLPFNIFNVTKNIQFG